MSHVYPSRSALAKRAPAATLRIAACGVAVAPLRAAPHDPIHALYEEWKRVSAEWKAAIGSADEDRLEGELRMLEERICTAAPTTREGAIAQLKYAMDDFGPYMFGNVPKDLDRKLFANLLSGLETAS